MEFTYNKEDFAQKLEELVNNKKSFLIYVYGDISKETGKSWCPDCETAKPIVSKAKEEIFDKNKDKEVYFINLPVIREEREVYKSNKIVKLTRIPSIIFYYKGKEIGRLVEGELFEQSNVNGFFSDVFQVE